MKKVARGKCIISASSCGFVPSLFRTDFFSIEEEAEERQWAVIMVTDG